ncbi:phospholipase-like protein [Tanacetum coccineum]
MERYNQTFKCTCERGDVVLRTSRKPYSYGKQYYACPYSKPGTQDRGCGYFMWMDDLRLHISSSSGSSTPPSYSPGTSTRPSYSPGSSRSAQNLGKAECSNCKFLAEKIKTLEAKIKILEGALEMERHPEKHTLDSVNALRDRVLVVVYVHTSNFNLWWSSSVQLGINGGMVMMLVILARGNDNHAKLCYRDGFVHVILVNGSWKVLNGGRASVIVLGLVVMFLGSSYVDVSCEAIGRRC